MMVTLVPKAAYTSANSIPMAPAPTTASVLGASCDIMASVESQTRSWSILRKGRSRGREPVARMTCLPVRVCLPPSLAVTSTWPLPASRPRPGTCVTLFFLNRKPIPFTSRSETWRERFTACAMSVLISPTVTPNSLAWPRWVIMAALSSSALVGMQPMLRQTPPRKVSSTHAVLYPSCAALIAAT